MKPALTLLQAIVEEQYAGARFRLAQEAILAVSGIANRRELVADTVYGLRDVRELVRHMAEALDPDTNRERAIEILDQGRAEMVDSDSTRANAHNKEA
jgi:hypothetical protein